MENPLGPFGSTDGDNRLRVDGTGTNRQSVGAVLPDTRYTLTVDYDADFFSPSGSTSGKMTLFVDGTDVAFVNLEDDDISGIFVTESFLWDSPSAGPLIDGNMEISLFSSLDPNNRFYFDNVRFTSESLSLLDDDLDGVPNDEDMCPGQDDLPDTDGDGIPDCLDENPTLFCGANTILVGFECVGTSGQGFDCGPGTILNDDNKCVPDYENICGLGTILNDENQCVPDLSQQIMCGPGTILNDENKCVPDYANVCGPGTILNENNQCVPDFDVPSADKVEICHKGKNTLSISSNAVPAHLAHGDTLGPCQ